MQDISLNSLALVDLNITDEGIENLKSFLEKSEILRKLDLSENLLSFNGAHYLGQGLILNKSLRSLNLNDNKIGSKGI